MSSETTFVKFSEISILKGRILKNMGIRFLNFTGFKNIMKCKELPVLQFKSVFNEAAELVVVKVEIQKKGCV